MGKISDIGSESRSDIVCLGGDGSKPSHQDNGCSVNLVGVHSVCYGVCGYWSQGMLSNNPKVGFYEADTTRALDLNGGNPCCNQGGVCVVEIHNA